jgi:hypothetical protein
MAELEADNFNLKHKVGCAVRFWTGMREGEGRAGHTWTEASLAHSGHAVVYLRDSDGKNVGMVLLSHVEVLND